MSKANMELIRRAYEAFDTDLDALWLPDPAEAPHFDLGDGLQLGVGQWFVWFTHRAPFVMVSRGPIGVAKAAAG